MKAQWSPNPIPAQAGCTASHSYAGVPWFTMHAADSITGADTEAGLTRHSKHANIRICKLQKRTTLRTCRSCWRHTYSPEDTPNEQQCNSPFCRSLKDCADTKRRSSNNHRPAQVSRCEQRPHHAQCTQHDVWYVELPFTSPVLSEV